MSSKDGHTPNQGPSTSGKASFSVVRGGKARPADRKRGQGSYEAEAQALADVWDPRKRAAREAAAEREDVAKRGATTERGAVAEHGVTTERGAVAERGATSPRGGKPSQEGAAREDLSRAGAVRADGARSAAGAARAARGGGDAERQRAREALSRVPDVNPGLQNRRKRRTPLADRAADEAKREEALQNEPAGLEEKPARKANSGANRRALAQNRSAGGEAGNSQEPISPSRRRQAREESAARGQRLPAIDAAPASASGEAFAAPVEKKAPASVDGAASEASARGGAAMAGAASGAAMAGAASGGAPTTATASEGATAGAANGAPTAGAASGAAMAGAASGGAPTTATASEGATAGVANGVATVASANEGSPSAADYAADGVPDAAPEGAVEAAPGGESSTTEAQSDDASQAPASSKPSRSKAGDGQKAERDSRPRRRIVMPGRVIVAILVVAVLALGGLVGYLCMMRWSWADDAADIQGSWHLSGQPASVTITADQIDLAGEATYSYTLDPQAKVIYESLGKMSGASRYRFSADRNSVALLDDGSSDWWANALDDLSWYKDCVIAQITGGEEPDLLHGESGVVVYRQGHDANGVVTSATSAATSNSAEASSPSNATEASTTSESESVG